MPYQRAIKQLEKMDNSSLCVTPFEKLQALTKVSEIIKEEIKDFWLGVDVKKDKLTLDGD